MDENTCSYDGCNRPRIGDSGNCIFHALSEKKGNPSKFRRALAQEIRKWRNEKADKWDFKGWVFVDREKNPNLFHRAFFPVAVSFDRAVFMHNADFVCAIFVRDGYFGNASFRRNAYFRGATFTQDADFGRVKFNQVAEFRDTSFMKNVAFNMTTFEQNAIFINSRFKQDVNFTKVEFASEADFRNSTFMKDVDFRHAIFRLTALFYGTKFNGMTDFFWATFANNVNFDRVQFIGFAYFEGTTFTQKIDFVNTQVFGWLILRRLNLPQQNGYWLIRFDQVDFGEKGVLDLRDNDLQEHNPVSIRECNLGRILLSRTDLENIRFYVEDKHYEEARDTFLWSRFHSTRRCTGDEWIRTPNTENSIEIEELPSWNDIELTYQKLARKFRDDLNHPVANDCERGFFEARRFNEKGKNNLRGWCNYALISIYKYASYYSGWVWLPIFWLFIINLLVAPGLYDLTLLNRDITLVPPAHYLPSLEAVISSLRVVALDRTWLGKKMCGDGITQTIPQSDQFWVSFIAVLQMAATAALIALFILALRRRFKHGD